MNAWAHPTHHAKRQLDCCTHFHTTMQRSPHWLQWDAANSPPKLPLPIRRSPPKSNTPIPSPTPLTTPNGIRIQSAMLSLLTCADGNMGRTNVQYHEHSARYSDRDRCTNNCQQTDINRSHHTISDGLIVILPLLLQMFYGPYFVQDYLGEPVTER